MVFGVVSGDLAHPNDRIGIDVAVMQSQKPQKITVVPRDHTQQTYLQGLSIDLRT